MKVCPLDSQNYFTLKWLRDRVILVAKNEDVHEIMNQMLAMLPGVTEYKSIDTVVDADEIVSFPPEFLNSLESAGLPPHRLLLKVGRSITLLRNLDAPKLCNGTRLCVKKMLGNVIEATILTGKFSSHGYHSFRRIFLLASIDCSFQ
jgi:ATP-dependent DNA helicase PIF1